MTTLRLLQPERIYKIYESQSNLYAFSRLPNDKMFSIYGFRLFDISIDIVLSFEFWHNISMWKMMIFDEVKYIEIESALGCLELHQP